MHGICANTNPSCAERLKKALHAGSHAAVDFRPGCAFRKRPPQKAQKPVQRLRAAHKLSRISADIHTDSGLHLKSQMNNCED
jgi:hypothetical protein